MKPEKLKVALAYLSSIRQEIKSEKRSELALLLSPDLSIADLETYFERKPNETHLDLLRAILSLEYGRIEKKKIISKPSTIEIRSKKFQSIRLTTPIDWHSEKLKFKGWKRQLNTLRWMKKLLNSEDHDPTTMEQCLLLYHSKWVSFDLPDRFTWDEHAMAERVASLIEILDKYIASAEVLSIDVLKAIIQIILGHVALMCDDRFYAKEHNHGLLQDVSILNAVKRLQRLRAAEYYARIASERILTHQIDKSLLEDGSHRENSPGYHLLFVKKLQNALQHENFSNDIRERAQEIRRRALESLAYHVMPNLNLVPFGDTGRRNVRAKLDELFCDNSLDGESALHKLYSCLLGKDNEISNADLPPPSCIFPMGGYAILRSSWSKRDDELSAYAKCGFKSQIHKHADDGSVVVYGSGRELLIDPGKFTNEKKAGEGREGALHSSHNVLRFADDPPTFVPSLAKISGHDFSRPSFSYVVLRIEAKSTRRPDVSRVIFLIRPQSLLVVDFFKGGQRTQDCRSQFLLHPDLKPDRAQDWSDCLGFHDASGRGLIAEVPVVEGAACSGFGDANISAADSPFFPRIHVLERTRRLELRHKSTGGINAIPVLFSLHSTPNPQTSSGLVRLSFSGNQLTVVHREFEANVVLWPGRSESIFKRPLKKLFGRRSD